MGMELNVPDSDNGKIENLCKYAGSIDVVGRPFEWK